LFAYAKKILIHVLGLEHEFEQKLLPDGRISIDGFICVFDVSEVGHRPIARQIEHVQCILMQLAKTKKPVVLVTTKNDEVQRPYVMEAEHLVTRKELRGAGPIPVVETSAHENVNIELAFMTLAHLIERGGTSTGKNRPRTVPYAEAAKARREVIEVATEAYQGLIRLQV
jgi:50S ribosomal subunit-associated GTPase HflX